MKRMIGVLIFIGMIFTPVFSFSGEEIQVGYLPVSMSLPTFVALEKGFFTEKGLNVKATQFLSGTLIMDALITGRIDVNAGSASVLKRIHPIRPFLTSKGRKWGPFLGLHPSPFPRLSFGNF